MIGPRLSRRETLAATAAALVWPTLGAAAEPAFAVVAPQAAAALRQSSNTPMRAYALRGAQQALARAPRPLPVVHTEGTLPGQGIYDQSVEAKRDWQAALDAALGFALNGDAAMATKAVELVAAWLPVYRLSMNPIDETDFDRFLVAMDLLAAPSGVEPAYGGTRARIDAAFAQFCRNMASGYLDAMPRLRGGTATNNWQSHRVKLAALSAFATGDAALVARARAAFAKQLADNIRADGATLDFLERDAIHYAIYDLEPLVLTALAARSHGQDWYADAGGALPRALAWLAPYAEGTETHEEFVRSPVEFDRARAAAGIPGYSGQWRREEAEYLFTLATRLDRQFASIAAGLTPGFDGTRRPRAPWLHLTIPV
jgi:hypothetical protein